MAEANGDPELFTTQFNIIYESYLALGGNSDDIVSNFAGGLQHSTCDAFNQDMSNNFTIWDQGDHHLPWGPKNTPILADFAAWKSHAISRHTYLQGAGKWTSVSMSAKLDTQNSEIIAMQSEIQQLKMKGGLKSASQTTPRRSTRSSNGRKQSNGPKSKNKKDRSNQRRQRMEEEWRKTPPGPNDPHEKMVNGKKEIWCTYHNLWQRHTSEECKLGKKQRAASANAHNVNSASYASAAQANLHSLAALSRCD